MTDLYHFDHNANIVHRIDHAVDALSDPGKLASSQFLATRRSRVFTQGFDRLNSVTVRALVQQLLIAWQFRAL
jgi:hypothetical protein